MDTASYINDFICMALLCTVLLRLKQAEYTELFSYVLHWGS